MQPNSKNRKKILVYLIGSLGDSIVAIPALRAVRRHFAGAEIVLLQNFQAGAGLVKVSDVIPGGLVDRYLSYDSGLGPAAKVNGFYRLNRVLRREKFDAAVYLVISERTAKSVSRDKLFFRSCGIKDLFGFHAFSSAELYPTSADGRPAMTEHEALRKLRRLELDRIEFLPDVDLQMPLIEFSASERQFVVEWITGRSMNRGGKLIAIAPGCKTLANSWPLENFIELGRRLLARENCEIVVVGGKAEREIGEQMTAAWGGGINAAGLFPVRESAALLAACDSYIGLDTGTTHLAAAVGTPCFALYGERNNQGHWYPLGGGHTVLFHPVECAGCRLYECPVQCHPCMTGISLESAWANLEAFLERRDECQGDSLTVVSV